MAAPDEERAGADAEGAAAAIAPPKKRRWPRVLAFVLTFLVVLGVAAYVAFPRIARAMVQKELAARGLRMDQGTLDVSLTKVVIDGAELVSTEGATLEIAHLEVDHDLVSARAVRVRDVTVRGERAALEKLDARLRGTPATVEDAKIVLTALGFGLPDDTTATLRFDEAKREDAAYVIDGLSASLKIPSMGETLSLTAATAELLPAAKEGESLSFTAPRDVAGGEEKKAADDASDVVTLEAKGRGKIGVRHLRYVGAPESLTFSIVDLEEVKVTVQPQKREIKLRADRIGKDRLARFGIEPPGDVSGEVTVTLDDLAKKSAKATFDVKLQGFVPPHPRELNGIVFGDATRIRGETDARLEGTTPRGTLSNLVLEAGVLTMKGDGSFDGAGVEVTMQGSIACSELATSAISAHLGFSVGMGASPLSRRFLGGTVGVTVKVKAEYASLDRPTISPNAVLRCSLKLGL